MTKVKILLITLLTGLILFIAPSLVNAAETFTTSDGIVATKIVENTDGTVDFKLTNIALSAEGQYTWAVGTTSNGSDIPEKEWFTMGDFSETNKSAVLSLTPSVDSIKKILRTTNTAWLYIKNVANNKYVVDALKVDLTLPALNACVVTKTTYYQYVGNKYWYDVSGYEIEIPYSIKNMYYKIEKITDENIIKRFKECKGDYSKLDLASISKAPETGWITSRYSGNDYRSQGVYIRDIPTDDGLYYLWIKGKDTDSKQIIGYTLINREVDEDAPAVNTIYVSSPESGTYKTSQTIKINVEFSEKITGTTVPTLKIRFGESPIRSLTNGTIKNGTSYGYITYSYNIQSDDKGQLAAVGLEGGTIKDTSGNDVKLSCPLISGNTIKANTEGTTINQTDNQDKVNNNKSNNTVSDTNTTTNATTNNVSSQTNGTTGNTNTAKNTATNANTNKTTNTVAKSNTTTNTTQKVVNKLPKTGISLTIIFVIITIITIGAIAYIKYNNLKGI